ncbi:alkaline phosphatase PhoX [Intrasporangium sp.]|uniref:alkaline phosphatase PhoX n=1 Tax=Intrasporangium sp. TaxID=1925024 RepID=UPI00293B2C67|nr:alkaline phosphatase PhoX [Intrasporangium sp.]MDV3220614.1 PhoX family protein [Intrasporangium sp.]
MKKHLTIAAAAAALVGLAAPAYAANGPFGFEPIEGSAYGHQTADWDLPLVAPDGFTQQLVADETVLDIYGGGTDDLTDMNVHNETGVDAGRYLYRTHEVGSNGALSVVDLRTGEAKVIAQRADWRRLDGIEWTAWGTVLFAEETTGGRLFEAFLDPQDPTNVVKVEERREVGVLRHEGIGAMADGTVFVIDELNGGSIFKFVPTTRGDLSDGQLYALKVTGLSDAEQSWSPADYLDKAGAFEWVALDMDQVVVDADAAANAVSATEFGRPEDVEIIGQTVYVANTTEDRVVAIDLKKNVLNTFVHAGDNVPAENRGAGVTGFNGPDNLARSADGRLWIVEDNVPSDIWATQPDLDGDGLADEVELFASLKDPGAEISGIYFGKDPKTLFFNIQHPTKSLADGTWRITRR